MAEREMLADPPNSLLPFGTQKRPTSTSPPSLRRLTVAQVRDNISLPLSPLRRLSPCLSRLRRLSPSLSLSAPASLSLPVSLRSGVSLPVSLRSGLLPLSLSLSAPASLSLSLSAPAFLPLSLSLSAPVSSLSPCLSLLRRPSSSRTRAVVGHHLQLPGF
ncbi:hypothetical protein ACLOJK_041626 [Asimina triloba]